MIVVYGKDKDGTFIERIEYRNKANGRTFVIGFEPYIRNRFTEFNVVFSIVKKRKAINKSIHNKDITGDGSIDGLLWAKEMIVFFQENLLDIFNTISDDFDFSSLTKEQRTNIKISVFGSEKRRHNIYRHYLSKIGFHEEGISHNSSVFSKNIVIEDVLC